MAAPIYLKRASRRGPTWREVVLMHAVARIAYSGLVDHVQTSWVKTGATGARQLLHAGVDDLGGTLYGDAHDLIEIQERGIEVEGAWANVQ